VEDFVPPPELSVMCFNGTSGGDVMEGDRKNTITTQSDLDKQKESLKSDAVSGFVQWSKLEFLFIAQALMVIIGASALTI
jgi:hypothetical protein